MTTHPIQDSTARRQGILLGLAALFVVLSATALCISPAARARSWQVDYRWQVWIGVVSWLVSFGLLHRHSLRWLRNHDPYLLPVTALLSGWGLLTIWRIYPQFGLRQSLWLLIACGLILLGLRVPRVLSQLRRFKYLWLSGGLLLTGLTLVIGTNPNGGSLWNYWLGCCGAYLQPSEPLKLLLVVYLAAYLADRVILPQVSPVKSSQQLAPKRTWLGRIVSKMREELSTIQWQSLGAFAPTLVMTGLALSFLLAQRDLGTASIFLVIYAAMAYMATGQVSLLVGSGLALAGAGLAGYYLFAVVQLRVDAWLNPWLDPSGRSYQIVQSLIALANGGLIGRGPGMGNPGLVPLAHSDFILTAIVEESGLLGAVGLMALLAILALRGLRCATRAPNSFQRYLSAGLTIQLVGQAVLIIGGNERMLPLTGVTLPFVSYGGSSLLVSFASLFLLLKISQESEITRPELERRSILVLGALLALSLASAALISGWWTVVRAANLVERTDNPRRYLTDNFVPRGDLLDRNNSPLVVTTGSPAEYTRLILYPDLSPVLGYNDPNYGQSGLEGSLDPILSGRQGSPAFDTWLNHLFYGQPPPGLDVRLSLDLTVQEKADSLLGARMGAVVVLNPVNGEILALASHPTFDASQLADQWDQLVVDPEAPLFNRATQGLYPPGAVLGPFLLAALDGITPAFPPRLTIQEPQFVIRCAIPVTTQDWSAALRNGCPGAVEVLSEQLGAAELHNSLHSLGLFAVPLLDLPVTAPSDPGTLSGTLYAAGTKLNFTPLQMALAAAVFSNQGSIPAPHLLTAVKTPNEGWMPEPAQGIGTQVYPAANANATAHFLADAGGEYWSVLAQAPNGPEGQVSWFIGGTLPDTSATTSPLTVVVLIEENDPRAVLEIGQALLAVYR